MSDYAHADYPGQFVSAAQVDAAADLILSAYVDGLNGKSKSMDDLKHEALILCLEVAKAESRTAAA